MPTTSNFGWNTPADTDLVKDGALAIRTLGNNIDTSLVDLKGGTTGQILSKNSNTDLDYTWINNDQGDITEVQGGTGISVASGTGPVPVITNTVATEFDAKGDLVVGTGADTFDKLTVGTNEHRLVADSAETTGLKYVADTTNYAITAKGDILAGTAADTVAPLTLGSNNQVLTVDTSTSTGLKWATPATSGFVGCSLYKTSNQSIANTTDVALTFDSEHFDTDSFHSTVSNTSRITIPSGKGGKYLIVATLAYAGNATGFRAITIAKNGGGVIITQSFANVGASDEVRTTGTAILDLVAGDYIEFYTYQNSGGALNVIGTSLKSVFSAVYLGA